MKFTQYSSRFFILFIPHTGLIRNFGYSIPILFFIWLFLKYTNQKFADIGFSFASMIVKIDDLGLYLLHNSLEGSMASIKRVFCDIRYSCNVHSWRRHKCAWYSVFTSFC
jgi:hypothetical protein